MLRKMLSVAILFSLSGCGMAINLSQNHQTKAYTRVSNSVFLSPATSPTKVHIIIQNTTPFPVFNTLHSAILTKVNKDVQVVKDLKLADIIIQVNIRQFSQVPLGTIENIEKYWSYFDAADVGSLKEIESMAFAISDKEVGVSDAKNHPVIKPGYSSEASIVQKITKNDFVSGMVVGGVVGFWAGGTSPIGAALGAMAGGTLTFALQSHTLPLTYMAVVDLQISQKTPYAISYETKYLHKEDDNSTRWHHTSQKENLNHKRIKMYTIIKRSLLKEDMASEIANEKLAESIAYNISH